MFKKLPMNYISAFVILIAVILWVLSGVLFKDSDQEVEIVNDATEEKIITVRASEFEAKDKTYFLTVRGRTEVEKKVMLKPKTSSTILKKLDKGSFVKKGQIICTLDPENRSAALDEAVANKTKAQLQYDAIKQLADEGYRSENAVATADAALKGAIARVEMATNELNNTKINAPFDGYIEDVFVEVGDLISPTQPCAKLMQLDPITVTGEVTEKNVELITENQLVDVKLLDGSNLKGKIDYVSKSANPSTRTYKVEALVSNREGLIREGLTADMKVPLKNVKAHLIPSYLLSLNDLGDLGIKIVNQNIVRFIAIQIIEDTPEGIWVAGLPSSVTIITVGQEYVMDGQKIKVQLVN
jgi:multidrug efflux system membrane fusion protein